jgi:hypothetical protein
MSRWQRRFDSIPPPRIDAHVVSAETAAEGIVHFIPDHEIDLIVLSGTGRSAWSTLLLGSNAREVLRTSPIPILLVPAELCAAPTAFLRKMSGMIPEDARTGVTAGAPPARETLRVG